VNILYFKAIVYPSPNFKHLAFLHCENIKIHSSSYLQICKTEHFIGWRSVGRQLLFLAPQGYHGNYLHFYVPWKVICLSSSYLLFFLLCMCSLLSCYVLFLNTPSLLCFRGRGADSGKYVSLFQMDPV
jgi:hypothetical protein